MDKRWRTVCIVPVHSWRSTDRSNNGSMVVRCNSIWCHRTSPTDNVWCRLGPWRTSWILLLFLLLLDLFKSRFSCVVHSFLLFLQLNDLLRCIVAGDLLLVAFSSHFRDLCTITLCFRINRCPVLGDDCSEILERNLICSYRARDEYCEIDSIKCVQNEKYISCA